MRSRGNEESIVQHKYTLIRPQVRRKKDHSFALPFFATLVEVPRETRKRYRGKLLAGYGDTSRGFTGVPLAEDKVRL